MHTQLCFRINFSNFLPLCPAGLQLLLAVYPNSCHHDCNLKCLIVQLSASTSCNTTSKVQKYPFTFKHCHSVAADFFSPLCFSLCSVQTPVQSSSCSALFVFSPARVQFPRQRPGLARLPNASALLRGRAPLFLDS